MYDVQKPSQEDLFADRTALVQVERDIWTLLAQAVDDRDCGWRLPVIATRCDTGVRQRTVVLRAVDATQRQVMAHTDIRSPKILQIRADERVSLLFYDSARAIQLSVTATGSVHTDDSVADALWNAAHVLSLKYCLAPLAPGTECAAPEVNLPAGWLDRVPTRDELAAARANFAALRFSVRHIDWLSLSRSGNLRAEFSYTPEHAEVVDRRWVAP